MGHGGPAGVSSLTRKLTAPEGNLRGRFLWAAVSAASSTARPWPPKTPGAATSIARGTLFADAQAGRILLVLVIAFGMLGFVIDVAGGLARIVFFVRLVGLALSLAGKAIRRDRGPLIGSIRLTLPARVSSHAAQ